MKAKVTKPDGTVIELEGEPLELAIFLPDLKGFQLPQSPPVFTPTIFEVRCTCNDPWFGIVPAPQCPLHPYSYKLTFSDGYTGTVTTTVKTNQPPLTDRELEFNP